MALQLVIHMGSLGCTGADRLSMRAQRLTNNNETPPPLSVSLGALGGLSAAIGITNKVRISVLDAGERGNRGLWISQGKVYGIRKLWDSENLRRGISIFGAVSVIEVRRAFRTPTASTSMTGTGGQCSRTSCTRTPSTSTVRTLREVES